MSVKITRVQRLALTHFRGIRHLTLDFTENVTVLVGVNGAGKTSIIEAIRALMASLLHAVQTETGGTLPRRGKQQKQLQSIYLWDSDVHVEQRKMSLDISAVVANQNLNWSIQAQSMLPGELETYSNLKEVFTFAAELGLQTIDDPLVELPLAIYYAVGRGSVRDYALEEGIQNQLSAYEDALTGTSISSARPFISWFRRREDYENEKRLDDSDFRDAQLQAVRRATESLLPGFSDLRVRRQPMRMVIRKGKTELELRHLSEGERYLLALGADIARRLALANPVDEQPELCSALVLIDEIDTHLHPSWQRHVVPSLARTFPNCQFIVTTHSPQVLSEVRPECIYLLLQEGKQLHVVRPEASFGRDSNRILEDILGVAARPDRIKDGLREYFRLIDSNALEEAKKLRLELEQEIGRTEPEFARADVLIRRKELLNRETHRQGS